MSVNAPTPRRPCRILIAENGDLLRAGIVAILAREKSCRVCGIAKDRKSTLALLEQEKPDLLLLSFALNGCDPVDLVKGIAARFPATRIVVINVTNMELYGDRLLRAGAATSLPLQATIEQFTSALRTVMNLGSLPAPSLRKAGSITPFSTLTDRELHVFQLIGKGTGTGDIARELGLSRKTIEYYREEIKRKLGYRDAAELNRGAFEYAQRLR